MSAINSPAGRGCLEEDNIYDISNNCGWGGCGQNASGMRQKQPCTWHGFLVNAPYESNFSRRLGFSYRLHVFEGPKAEQL